MLVTVPASLILNRLLKLPAAIHAVPDVLFHANAARAFTFVPNVTSTVFAVSVLSSRACQPPIGRSELFSQRTKLTSRHRPADSLSVPCRTTPAGMSNGTVAITCSLDSLAYLHP